MKKISLLALAVPALFVACTQDEIVENVSNQQSVELLGKVAGDVDFVLNTPGTSATRLSWNQQNVKTWDQDGDAFSLFWVSNKAVDGDGNYFGTANAAYVSKDGGAFTSQNIIYEGSHVIVYPLDTKHTTEKLIAVTAGGAVQDNTVEVGDRSVFVSDLLTVQAAPANEKDRIEGVIYAGYNEPVEVSVRPLSSYLALNLDFEMSKNMTKDEVRVEGVDLIVKGTDADAFTYGGNLNLDGTYMSLGSITDKGYTLSLKVNEQGSAALTEDGKFVANFTLLPSEASIINNVTTSEIVVKTNFGDVTITDAIDVVNPNAAADANPYMSAAGLTAEEVEEAVTPVALDFKPMLTTISSRAADTESSKGSYGRTVVRNVTVDMSKADINGRDIKTSTDLINAYNVYTKLGKTGTTTFDLVPAENNFLLTPAAVAKVNAEEYKNIVLTPGTTTTLTLVKDGDQKHATIPVFANGQFAEENFDLVLANEGGDWAIDVNNAANVNVYNSVTNEGTLTLSKGAGETVLAKALTNKGTIVTSGKVAMPTALTSVANSIVNIPVGTELALDAANNSFAGTVTINGVMKVHASTLFDETAVVTVDGTGMLISKNGMNEVHNRGTIYVNAPNTVQISSNDDGTIYGNIIVKTRECSENIIIANKAAMGYIKWTVELDEEDKGVFTQDANEKINYLILNSTVQFAAHDQIKYLEVNENKFLNIKGDVSVQTLTVGAGAYVTIPAGHSVELTGDLNNNGDIVVNGQFTYPVPVTKEGSVYWQNL